MSAKDKNETIAFGREVLPVASQPVDIVVPVYLGLSDTRRCLESIFRFPQVTPFEVVVVNDASPDPELCAYVEQLAAQGRVTLLDNEYNVGFVDSANWGMMLHPGRDVVILNSDTEVHGTWLDRLRNCALTNAFAGTVTPFSNNATICSYPRFLEVNPLPQGWSLAALDSLFGEVNEGGAVDLPSAVGFCTYITRSCLDRVGYLDSLHFGRGYGEENDFSMRAAAAGFKNLLCADTFVYHSGGVSFGGKAVALSDAAQETLRRLHPGYEPLIHAHFARDPERIWRRRVDIARLVRSPKAKLLLMTHRLGGGTEKHVQDLVGLLAPQAELLIMRPAGCDRVSLEWANSGEEFSAFFALDSDYSQLVDFLRGVGLDRIHCHHAVEFPHQALQLLQELELPYDVTIHDYYWICPQWNLIRKDGNYCQEPDSEGCKACLAQHPALIDLDIGSWRSRSAAVLQGADRVIAPSQDVLDRIKRYVPAANYLLLPHPEEEVAAAALRPSTSSGEIKVLVLGELSVAKGVRLLESCAVDAQERGLPLCFRILGWAHLPVKQEPEVPLTLLGPYDDERLLKLIERERADIIFFPARWPETYSYTLSTAMKSGLTIVAPELGAFTERLQDYPAARLLDWRTPPAQWNDIFISLARTPLAEVRHES